MFLYESSLECYYAEGHDKFIQEIWPWLDFCLYAFAPSVFIFVSNLTILAFLWKANHRRAKLSFSTKENGINKAKKRRTSSAKMKSITAMLLSRTFAFLILMFPFSVFSIGITKWQESRDVLYHEKLFLVHSVSVLLAYLAHATNFYTYCASGPQFRKALLAMCLCSKKSKSPGGFETRKSSNSTDTTSTLGKLSSGLILNGNEKAETDLCFENEIENDSGLESSKKIDYLTSMNEQKDDSNRFQYENFEDNRRNDTTTEVDKEYDSPFSTKDDSMVENSVSETQQGDAYDHIGEITKDTLAIGMARDNDKGSSVEVQTEDDKDVENCKSGMNKIFDVKL